MCVYKNVSKLYWEFVVILTLCCHSHITVCLLMSVPVMTASKEVGEIGTMDKNEDSNAEDKDHTHIDYHMEQFKLLQTVGTGDHDASKNLTNRSLTFRHLCPSLPVSP